MDLRLDGRTALVTGSDSGIGRAIAVIFAEAGADVTVTFHSDEAGARETARMVEAAGRRSAVVGVDVGNRESVAAMFAAHDTAFGRLDILVNNAGVGRGGGLLDGTDEDWELVLHTNLYGPYYAMREAARRMVAQGTGGRIINISSVHEEACWPTPLSYNVSKGGLRNLTRTAAIELAPHGINVTDIAPGMIITPMNARALVDPEYVREAEGMIVAGRAGMPVDVAGMALFLASDAASYVTGSTHYVDGGWMLTWPAV